MPVIRCSDQQSVKIIFLYQLPDIFYEDGFAGSVLQCIETVFDGAVFHITDIGDFDIGQLCIRPGQVRTAAVHTHHGEYYFIGWCSMAEYREIQNLNTGRRSQRTVFNKISSFHTKKLKNYTSR